MTTKTGADVIVFGATGAVGGAAAQEAASRGSKVWLAMRDTTKEISWLTKDVEANGSYTRVKADLSDPASVVEAVQSSGAQSAFVYAIEGDMSDTFQALKKAGVTWLVLLSSFTIEGDLTKYTPDTIIPYRHAKAELDIQKAGIAYGAVRPGFFASNIFSFYNRDIKQGEISLLYPEIGYDFIVPENIGQVAGVLLTAPKPNLKPTDPEVVYLHGPRMVSQQEAVTKIGKAMGKDVKINSLNPDEFLEYMKAKGLPELFVKYFIWQANGIKANTFYESRGGAEARGNVKLYTGKEPTEFDEYLESVKGQL